MMEKIILMHLQNNLITSFSKEKNKQTIVNFDQNLKFQQPN
jgi:hypothetical protein